MTLQKSITQLLPHGSQWRNKLRKTVFEALCLFTRLTMSKQLPEPPHRGVKICRVVRGDLAGRILAHPLQHASPSFVLGMFEPHIGKALHRYSKPGDVIYDVGANIGYHTLQFAQVVGKAGRILAFEPNPPDNASLRWNVMVNRCSNVAIIDAAVAASSGVLRFASFAEPGIHHIAGDNEPSDARLIAVAAVTLDEVVYEQKRPVPTLIKIDVEGAEAGVLEGAMRVLREAKPVVIAEIWPETRQQVFQLMSSLGYAVVEEHLLHGGGISDVVFTAR